MQVFTGNDLISLGVPQGPLLGSLLAQTKLMVKNGISNELILKEIKFQVQYQKDSESRKLKLRDKPLQIEAAIKTSSLEEEENLDLSLTKMGELTLCPVVEKACLMPDTCPSGLDFGAIPVGGAIQTDNTIIPAAHSSDLCCSMMATIFDSNTPINKILDAMQASTSFGPQKRPENPLLRCPVLEEDVWKTPFLENLHEIARDNLQTQGDGNHFFYLGTMSNLEQLGMSLDKNGYYEHSQNIQDSKLSNALVLVTHHGSRRLGAQIYKRGVNRAIKETNKIALNIPKNLAWLSLDSKIGKEYWEAITYAQKWTIANHKIIHEETMSKLGTKPITTFSNAHNFVWRHNNKIMHGKGATPAWKTSNGQKSIGIIPLNMASEILITLGNDNLKFLSFSPHGAGRNRSRTKTYAKYKDPKTKEINTLLLNQDLEASTRNLDIRWASNKPDISESPLGYKNKEAIKQQLEQFELAEIISEISPKGCIMAGEFPTPRKEKKKKVEFPSDPSLEYS